MQRTFTQPWEPSEQLTRTETQLGVVRGRQVHFWPCICYAAVVGWAPACTADSLFTHIHDAQTNAHQPVGPDSSCQSVAVAQQVRETKLHIYAVH